MCAVPAGAVAAHAGREGLPGGAVHRCGGACGPEASQVKSNLRHGAAISLNVLFGHFIPAARHSQQTSACPNCQACSGLLLL